MILFILFFLVLFLYSVFSYSLVDPNLVLNSSDIYWNFQNWMWFTFFSNGKLMAYVYFGIIISLFILYAHILDKLRSKKVILKNIFKTKYIILFLIIISPLLFSHNALSHDIFNYIFNAKMVINYGVDPHVKTALDFSDDLWVRFMHNTHTPAPYGRGWTYLSLIPFIFGFGKLTISLISFRVWSLLSIFLLYLSMQHLSKVLLRRNMNLYELALVFLNPLFLIEVVSNYHNDLWMMSLAVFGVSFLITPVINKVDNNKKKIFFISSLLFLGASVSIKLASLALLPIWILITILIAAPFRLSDKVSKKLRVSSGMIDNFIERLIILISRNLIKYVPDFAALLMFLPLFTARSQQFLPWYILWALVWIPFMKVRVLRNLVIAFTFSSSLRYIPWLANEMSFSDEIVNNQKLITWIIPAVYLFTNLRKIKSPSHYEKKGGEL